MRLAYCDVGYGGAGSAPYQMVYTSASNVEVRHCRIHHSLGLGLWLNAEGVTPLFEDIEFDHNATYPVHQSTIAMNPSYTNLSFHDNGTDALSIAASPVSRDVTLDGSPAALNGAPIHYGGGTIWNSYTLTITPGTTLKIASGESLFVPGGTSLIAEGTADLPITFTSQAVDPQPGDWGRLQFESTAVVRLAYCDVGYGGAGSPSNDLVYTTASNVEVRHCRIHHSLGLGLFLNADGMAPLFEDIEFDHNATYPVHQSTINMTPSYNSLNFHDNGVDALSISGGSLNRELTLDGTAMFGGKAILLQSSTSVSSGGRLILAPGTVIKQKPDQSLDVYGQLEANGNAANPVVFTSYADDAYGGDTNGDGNATQPAPGDWHRIFVSGSAAFEHSLVRYGAGTNAVDGALIYTQGGANVSIANSILSQGLYTGLLGDSPTVTVSNTLIISTDRGVSAHPGGVINILNSTVDDSRIGLLLHGGTLNIANTLVSNSTEYGILHDYLTPYYTIRYCDFWNPEGVNYGNIPDQTGLNGNISADPLYKDRERGNYRLDYRSPAIDSADGELAPETDIMGAPRYDDPRTPNTGIPTAGGAYADMGAFEFVEDAPSNINLVVTQVDGPPAALAGEQSYVTWTVANIGVEAAIGPWRDRVSLLQSQVVSPSLLVAGEALVGEGVILQPGESYQASAWVRTPGGEIGAYHWQVDANTHQDIFEGTNRFDNTGVSAGETLLDLPELTPDAPPLNRVFAASGQRHWFKLAPQALKDSLIILDTASSSGVVELLVGEGFMPSPQNYTFKQVELNSPDVSAFIPKGGGQTWYILVSPESLPGNNIAFTIQAQSLDFELIHVSPDTGGNIGTVTFLIYGGQLEGDDLFELIAPDDSRLAAEWVLPINSALVKASFDLTDLPTGSYDLSVSDAVRGSFVLNDAVQVVPGIEPEIWVELIGPDDVRVGDQATYQVQFGNPGNVDAPMPDLRLQLPQGVSLDWISDEAALYSLDPISATHEIVYSQPRLSPFASSSFMIRVKNPTVEGEVAYDGLLTGMPAAPELKEPWSEVEYSLENELISATDDELQVVAHLSDGAASGDLSYRLRVEDSPVAVPVTITLEESGGMENWYFEMTEPPGSVPMVRLLDSLSPQVNYEKLMKWAEGGWDWFEKVKYVYEKYQAVERLKAANRRRISQEQINNCLFNYSPGNPDYLLNKIQRVKLYNFARGSYVAVMGTEAMKEVLSNVPVGSYFDIHLEFFSGITGQAWEDSLYQAYRDDAFKAIGIEYVANYSRQEFMQKLLNNPTIKSCLEKKCKVSGSGARDENCKVRIKKKKKITRLVTSIDPNDIFGPQGAGSQRYIIGNMPLTYLIAFENMAEATAPAQRVAITNQLDLSRFDASTFSLGAIGFGNTVAQVPPGRSSYAAQIAVEGHPELLVEISAGLDADSGLITWTLTTLDALTLQPPEDPLVGFLPPNVNSPEGQGFVAYTVSLKPGLGTGTQVKNKASIVFDQNEAIETSEWLNTIDVDAPTSSVNPLPALSPETFTVSWAGSDAGSGVEAYDIYVSQDGGEFAPWLIGYEGSQAIFTGEAGHSYGFYSVATDLAGNRQPTPAAAQATTTVQEGAPPPEPGGLYLPLILRER